MQDFPQDRLMFVNSDPPLPDSAVLQAPHRSVNRAQNVLVLDVFFAGHMLLDAQVNGRCHAQMLVDTGAGNTVLSAPIAAEGGVELSNTNAVARVMNMSIPCTLAQAKRLEIGQLQAHNVPVVVWRKDVVFRVAGLPVWTVEGLLGMDLLRHFTVVLDYRQGQVELHKQSYPSGGLAQAPLVVTGEASPDLMQWRAVLPCQLGGTEVQAMLDSGQSIPLAIPRRQWDQMGLGILPIRMVDLKAGNILLRNVLATRTDRYDRSILGPSAFFANGYRRLIMDFPAGRLSVEK